MRTRFMSILMALAIIVLSANSMLAQSGANAGFEKLKTLVGEWHGQDNDGGEVRISYQLVSAGTAVMETIQNPGHPGMVTMYHLDGDNLAMTHYCAMGNQPRMKAEVPAGEIRNLTFSFVTATNMEKPSDGHMHNLTFNFKDGDHIAQTWTWRHGDADEPITFTLARKK